MISHGLQTANPPLLLNHQTPLGAKVHPQRYSHNTAHDVKHFRYMTQLKSIENFFFFLKRGKKCLCVDLFLTSLDGNENN